MSTAEILRRIATTGTDAEVADLYQKQTGRNITNCIPCQKKDARTELLIMAKKALQTEATTPTETVNGYTLAAKYTSRPTYIFDRLVQLRDETDLKFWLARMPSVLVAPAAPTEPATPTPVTPPADEATQDDNAIHGE